MLDEPLDGRNRLAHLLRIEVRIKQLVLDLLQQLLDCKAGGLGQRLAMDDRENVLEALPDVALSCVFSDILGKVLQDGTKDRPSGLGGAPGNQPFYAVTSISIEIKCQLAIMQRKRA
jgi:hypothetical protein